jgi:endonuclease-3
VKIEKDLAQILPTKEWTNFSHRLIIHGRRVCDARKPACERCVLKELCPSRKISLVSSNRVAE